MPPGAIYVGRPGRFGNPFIDMPDGTVFMAFGGPHFRVRIASNAAEAFRMWLERKLLQVEADHIYRWRRQMILDDLHKLRGHDLACWCGPDAACHADVLLDLANRETKTHD